MIDYEPGQFQNEETEVNTQVDLQAENAELRQRLEKAEAERDELRSEKLPNEKGSNRYGLDVAYFRKTINRELNRDLTNFKPSELARVLARLSVTADKSVISETEFSSEHNIEQQIKRALLVRDTLAKNSQLDSINTILINGTIEQLRKGLE
tara:strand:+ start:445 stop:900 length:456 start_codon:yes stop_codon:yes gene_type:complete